MPQRPKEHVRERMLQAGKEEFAARGYAGATMASIAKRAGVATGNLYRYFGGKEALFDAIFTDAFAASFLSLVKRRVASLSMTPLTTLDEAAARDQEELLAFWTTHRLQVVVLLDRADGSRLEGFGARFVDTLVKPTEAALRKRTGRRRLPAVAKFTLRQIFENTVNTIVAILERHDDPAAIRHAFAAFWSFQLAGLAALEEWIREQR